MNNYILVFYSMILLFIGEACNNKENVRLTPINEFTYQTNGLTKADYFKIDNKEYICHYDFTTHKKIIAESIDGSEVYNINLKPVLKKAHKIFAFDVIDWNNIIIIPAYAKHFYIINHKGFVKKTVDLSPFLQKNDHFELSSFLNNIIYNDTSLIFPLEFKIESIPDSLQSDPVNYDKARHYSPRLFKIDNFYKDSLVCHFGTADLYPRFKNENVVAYEMPNYKKINEQIIFFSTYSDSIYIIDPNTLEIKKSVQVQSRYTDLIVNHVTREQELNSAQSLITYNSLTDGHIVNIVYDQLSHHYLVFVRHKPNQTEDIYSSICENSIIILDSLFNQVEEIKMDHERYSSNCFSTSKGLYMGSILPSTSDNNREQKFNYTIFKYE